MKILTHCGFRPIYFDDSWWTFVESPDLNTNKGFQSGQDFGTLVLLDAEHAEYTSTLGGVIGLTRGGKQPEICS